MTKPNQKAYDRNMEDLEGKLSKQLEASAERRLDRKERYAVARQYGFSAAEAAIVMNWSVERMTTLAGERGYLAHYTRKD